MANDERTIKITRHRDEDAFWHDGSKLVIHEEPSKPKSLRLGGANGAVRRRHHRICEAVRRDPVTTPIISQVVRCGTSVGANYVEADDAVSKKEFLKNIGTCKKEAQATKHFLRMAVGAVPDLKWKARPLWIEPTELHLIFSKIWRSKP